MGNSSSQIQQSQGATQDIPVTSQPATQLPALDGTQDEEPQTLNRVAGRMDASVEDTRKKAKRARMKAAPRGKRRSAPQHTRGFAIQPSQEITDTQEEEQAGVGAEDEDVDMDAGKIGGAVDDVADSPPTGPGTWAAVNAEKPQSRKKRLHWQEDDVEPIVHDEDAEQGALEDIDVNTLNVTSQPPKQKKRKRSDIELERLQKDVDRFAPKRGSTPKCRPTTKRQKRGQDVEKHDAITAFDEVEEEAQDAVAHAKPQRRSKATKVQVESKPSGNDSEPNASKSASKPAKPVKAQTRSGSVDPSGTTTTLKTRSRRKQKPEPIEEAQEELSGAEKDPAVQDAQEAAAEDGNGGDQPDDQPVDSIPTPPESPDDAAQAVDGEDDAAQSNNDSDNEHDNAQHAATTRRARASQEVPAPVAEPGKSKKSNRRKQAAQNTQDAQADAGIEQRKDGKLNGDKDAGDDAHSKPKKRVKAAAASKNSENENKGDKEFGNNVDIDEEGSDEGSELQAGKTVRRSKKSKTQKKASGDDDEPSKSERGQIQGTWSKEERARADEIFEDVVRVTAIPASELKINIIDWKNPTPQLSQLKEALYEAFPERSFKSITRFCQRRYNSYRRGKWTAEQDGRLREAFELWPDQWTAISDHVDRFWEDCRTRWRDVLSRPEAKAESGPWSREEEMRLAKAVLECREIVLKETEDEEVREDPSKVDALISWKVVSEKMDNTRGAKRCREKWKRVKHLDLAADVVDTTSQRTKSGKPSGRLREVEEDYQDCEAGDVYDVLTEICNAVPDVTKVFDHETTFWSVVAIKNPDSRFKSSLRRRAFRAAVEDYPCKAVWQAETLAAKAKGVKDRMDVLHRKDQLELSRTYDGKPREKPVKKVKKKEAEVGEDSKAPAKKQAVKRKKAQEDADDASGDEADQAIAKKAGKTKAKRAKKASASKSREGKAYKSADLIVDSDDDNDEEAAASEVDVQVKQTQDEEAPVSGDQDVESPAADEDEGDGKADKVRARQQTDELSLDSRPADLSPSTFIERCKGESGKKGAGANERTYGSGGKKRKGEMKGGMSPSPDPVLLCHVYTPIKADLRDERSAELQPPLFAAI